MVPVNIRGAILKLWATPLALGDVAGGLRNSALVHLLQCTKWTGNTFHRK